MTTPIGHRKREMLGFETQYLIVVGYSHYEPVGRKHHWVCECKNCGNEFVTATSRCAVQKSCGCIDPNKTRSEKFQNMEIDHVKRQEWLRRAWI